MTTTFTKKIDAANIKINEWIVIKELGILKKFMTYFL